MILRECLDTIDELPNGLEGTAANGFLRDDVEPYLDLVEPGCIGRRVVDVVPWSSGQPAFNLVVLVRSVVVHNQVNVKICGNVLVDVVQEAYELLMSVSSTALREHVTSSYIESREERRGTVTDVVVRNPLDVAQPHWQQRLCALKRLGLALLIDT